MARRPDVVWWPVDQALQEVFRDVLSRHGRSPPMLGDVYVEMDRPIRGDATVVAEFSDVATGPITFRKVIHNADQLRESWFGLRRRCRGRVRYNGERLYSQEIENHLLELDLQAARERLSELERVTMDSSILQRAHQAYQQQCEIIQRNHQLRNDPSLNSPYQGLGATSWDAPRATLQALSQQAYQNMLAQGQAQNLYSAQSQANNASLTYQHMVNAQSLLRAGSANNDLNPYLTDTLAWFNGLGGSVGSGEANKKGMALLKEHLTPEQLQTYEAKQYFDVKGGTSGKTYRIHHGRQMNIRELDKDGKEVSGLCFLPQGGLVAGDCMLAQKNALELAEDKALKVANRFAVGASAAGSWVIVDDPAADTANYEAYRARVINWYGSGILNDRRSIFGSILGS